MRIEPTSLLAGHSSRFPWPVTLGYLLQGHRPALRIRPLGVLRDEPPGDARGEQRVPGQPAPLRLTRLVDASRAHV
jgi:hypothetical protein